MASSAAAGPVPVPLSVMTSPHAASPALSAAFGSGLLRIGGRPGGNRWSPANCKLFGVTAAGESVHVAVSRVLVLAHQSVMAAASAAWKRVGQESVSP